MVFDHTMVGDLLPSHRLPHRGGKRFYQPMAGAAETDDRKGGLYHRLIGAFKQSTRSSRPRSDDPDLRSDLCPDDDKALVRSSLPPSLFTRSKRRLVTRE